MTVEDRDHGYKQLLGLLSKQPQVGVLVGIRGQQGQDLLLYATVNEFGSEDGRIPERSFLRATVDENRVKYAKILEVAALRLLDGESPDRAFGIVGMTVVADVQRRIRDRISPANAPSTIRQKGSDVPLIDTGRLRQSIDYVVEAR